MGNQLSLIADRSIFAPMDFKETMQFLYAALPMYQRIGAAAYKKDLGNIRLLCEALDSPQKKFRSIHVAGTNGKGSSAHMLAAVLQSAGYKTGLYTSPHLKSFTERIRVNGREIKQQEVIDFVDNLEQIISEINPSFFEITVAMAFNLFAKEQVDIAVIEVGLGGRLDSTNIIMPEVSLITNISLDHENMLGDSLPKIAGEKAGIIKKKVPVVIGERQPEIESVFVDRAEAMEAGLVFASDNYFIEQAPAGRLNVISGKEVFLEGLKLDVKGDYQRANLPGVLAVIDILNHRGFPLSEVSIMAGLANVTELTGLKGRWQILGNKPLVVADTGHNEAGIKVILEQICSVSHDKLFMILGAVNDKSFVTILSLLPANATYFFCEAAIPRAMDADLLAQQAGEYGLRGSVIKDVNQALQQARDQASAEDMIFIGGSTFIVAELLEL
jgi:dihydrofolate synthase/folylpolyglutamate synthase